MFDKGQKQSSALSCDSLFSPSTLTFEIIRDTYFKVLLGSHLGNVNSTIILIPPSLGSRI